MKPQEEPNNLRIVSPAVLSLRPSQTLQFIGMLCLDCVAFTCPPFLPFALEIGSGRTHTELRRRGCSPQMLPFLKSGLSTTLICDSERARDPVRTKTFEADCGKEGDSQANNLRQFTTIYDILRHRATVCDIF